MEAPPKPPDLSPVLPPSPDEYNLQATLEAAQDELVRLLRERESIEWRINKLQNDVVHLAALCHVELEDPIKQLGLTDAVRWILAREEKKPLNVQQIVDALRKSYHDVSEYKNLAANIHTVIKRLVKGKEVGQAGGGRYVWMGGLPPPPPRPSWLRERVNKPSTREEIEPPPKPTNWREK